MEVLENKWVALEPLSISHVDALIAAASDGELWNLSKITTVPTPETTADYVGAALLERDAGHQQPFVVRRKIDGLVVGTTRYYEIEKRNRRRAIGWTWYAKSAQRTVVNTATKRLLLGHAFEDLDNIAVAFHTHVSNHASRSAILRLGAVEEGILRSHRIMADGSIRDTVCYSILDSEWPDVRAKLDSFLVR